MAKSTKSSKKRASYHDMLRERGYEECAVTTCGRLLADIASHKRDHKSGKIGPDGRRTDRKPSEVKAWRERAAANFAGKKLPVKKAARKAVKA